jgi:methionine aminopeptidase
MADGKEKKKAVKRIRKAVRKAVSKGVTGLEISRTVDAMLEEPAKPKKAVKKGKLSRS